MTHAQLVYGNLYDDRQSIVLIIILFSTFNTIQGPKLTFFGRRQLATEIFFQSPNGKMWSPKSVNKIFSLQRNTKQNFWSPQACRQNICKRCNQESNQCWNHLLTTLTHLHFHLLTPREYLNLHLISSQMFRLYLVINYGKISEHLWTPHRLDKYSGERMHVAFCTRNTYVMGNRWKKHGSEASHWSLLWDVVVDL